MSQLPGCCLSGCLRAQKVAYFSYAELHRNFRQLSTKTRVNSGAAWLPASATFPPLGNVVLPGCCLGVAWKVANERHSGRPLFTLRGSRQPTLA